jgi:hypothetical protein
VLPVLHYTNRPHSNTPFFNYTLPCLPPCTLQPFSPQAVESSLADSWVRWGDTNLPATLHTAQPPTLRLWSHHSLCCHLQAVEASLADAWVRWGDRLGLQRRLLRLAKPPRRWRRPPWAPQAEWEPPELGITGRPLNCTTGLKSR